MATAVDNSLSTSSSGDYGGAAGLERTTRAWSAVGLALVAGLVIGAIIGLLVGAGGAASYQASAEVSIQPDSVVDSNLFAGAGQLDTSTFIPNELVKLSGKQFARAVAQQLGDTSLPSFSFAEIDQTSIVSVTATASTPSQARAIANAALTVYRAQRTRSLLTAISAATASNTTRLSTIGAQLRSAATPAATRSPLETEYGNLLATQATLQQDRDEVGSVVTTVQSTRVSAAPSSTGSAALLGAVIGAVIALLCLLARRKLNPTVGTLRALAGLGIPVMLPPVPRARGRRGIARTRLATRALTHQLIGFGPTPPVVVVTGATAGVGTTFVATEIVRALTAAQPVLLTQDPPSVFGVETAVYDELREGYTCADLLRWARGTGRPIVVDAPSLDASDVAVALLDEDHATGLLVVGRGVSHPIDVFGAAQLLRTVDARVAGAVLNEVPPDESAGWRRLVAKAIPESLRRRLPPSLRERVPGPGRADEFLSAAPPTVLPQLVRRSPGFEPPHTVHTVRPIQRVARGHGSRRRIPAPEQDEKHPADSSS